MNYVEDLREIVGHRPLILVGVVTIILNNKKKYYYKLQYTIITIEEAM